MNHSENINELAIALSKAQAAMQPIYKDKKVAFKDVKYTYADLPSVLDACRKPLSDNGLAIVQTMEPNGTLWVLSTMLIHSSGQWMKSMLPINVNAASSALGSSISYMRRYALCAMISISPEDDDGQEANKEYERNINRPAIPPLKKVPVISSEQTKNIEYALSFCTQQFKDNFNKHMKERFQVTEYKDIPLENFTTVMNGINMHLANLEKEKSSKELMHV